MKRLQRIQPYTKDPIVLAGEAESSADRFKAPVPSIAVRPFINLSGDAKQDYVADGITDSLISDLARALPGISSSPAAPRSPIRTGVQTHGRSAASWRYVICSR